MPLFVITTIMNQKDTRYQTFNRKPVDYLKQPMFFGESLNVARYDQQTFPIFEKLIEKQLSFFWRPEEYDVSKDRIDFNEKLLPHEQHIFISNLLYQTLLDSVQGRSPSMAFQSIASVPELDTWIQTWTFSETIHSRSYTHILRNIFSDPSVHFESIIQTPEIMERAESVGKHLDKLIHFNACLHSGQSWPTEGAKRHFDKEHRKALLKALVSNNMLEAVRFYVSFCCTFAFAERELMEGNAKIVKSISRDEALHLVGTQYMINDLIRNPPDELWAEIVSDVEFMNELQEVTYEAVDQEKSWAKYLFKDGSMIGLNYQILEQYVDYIATQKCRAIGFEPKIVQLVNPVPWINSWLSTDAVQVAPQETEISSYLTGQIDSAVSTDDLGGLEL